MYFCNTMVFLHTLDYNNYLAVARPHMFTGWSAASYCQVRCGFSPSARFAALLYKSCVLDSNLSDDNIAVVSRLVLDISNLSDDNTAVVSRLGIVSAAPLAGAGTGLMIRLSVLPNWPQQPDKLVH